MAKQVGKIAQAEKQRELPEVCGGDGSNYWYFYSGGGYERNSPDAIAAYAKENFEPFKDMDVDTIKNDHIYWGTESSRFHAFYNGDTNVLFADPDKLPERQRMDAYENVKSLRETVKRKEEERVAMASPDIDSRYEEYRAYIKQGADAYNNLSVEDAASMSDEELCALYDAAMEDKDFGDD